MTQQNGNDKQREEREKFVFAFNRTMITIWCEQITLLNVIDTGDSYAHSKPSLSEPTDVSSKSDSRSPFSNTDFGKTLAQERKSQEATQATSDVSASVRRNPGSPGSITPPS